MRQGINHYLLSPIFFFFRQETAMHIFLQHVRQQLFIGHTQTQINHLIIRSNRLMKTDHQMTHLMTQPMRIVTGIHIQSMNQEIEETREMHTFQFTAIVQGSVFIKESMDIVAFQNPYTAGRYQRKQVYTPIAIHHVQTHESIIPYCQHKQEYREYCT